MVQMFSLDICGIIVTGATLWVSCKINILEEFCKVMKNYWFILALKLAEGVVSTFAQNDINNVSIMEGDRNDENQVRTIAILSKNTIPSKHLPKNDFHNVNYLINEVEIVKNMIVNETMTKKRVTEVKQQIKTLRNKMSLKFTKNKDSDTDTFANFEKVCKKLETTPFKKFKTLAKIELKEFLEKSKKEQLKLKK